MKHTVSGQAPPTSELGQQLTLALGPVLSQHEATILFREENASSWEEQYRAFLCSPAGRDSCGDSGDSVPIRLAPGRGSHVPL
jgi:hypothetical protein